MSKVINIGNVPYIYVPPTPTANFSTLDGEWTDLGDGLFLSNSILCLGLDITSNYTIESVRLVPDDYYEVIEGEDKFWGLATLDETDVVDPVTSENYLFTVVDGCSFNSETGFVVDATSSVIMIGIYDEEVTAEQLNDGTVIYQGNLVHGTARTATATPIISIVNNVISWDSIRETDKFVLLESSDSGESWSNVSAFSDPLGIDDLTHTITEGVITYSYEVSDWYTSDYKLSAVDPTEEHYQSEDSNIVSYSSEVV